MTRNLPLTLSTLREVQSREKNSDQLQNLPGRFWADAAEYLSGVREAVQEADDPTDARELYEEQQTATRLLSSLADRRRAKLVDLAAFEAAGRHTDTEAVTEAEGELYDTLVELLSETTFCEPLDEEFEPPVELQEVSP